VNDAELVWDEFIAEAGAEVKHLAQVTSLPAPDPLALAGLQGGLFNLRSAFALVGLDPGAVAAGYAEALVGEVLRGRAWAGPLRDALAELAKVLEAGVHALANPDLSGARIEDMSAIRAITARLGAMVQPVEAPPAEVEAAPPPPPSADESLWIPQVDEDMLDPFLEEAAERIEALSQKMLQLEGTPGDVELVREIFRDLHTIKGSSGFVGLRRMNRLAHAAEDLVGQVRDGKRTADRQAIDALLAALDALKSILEAAARGAKNPQRMSGTKIEVPVEKQIALLRAPPGATPPPGAAAMPAPAPTTAPHAEAASKQTLRVDFDKLDALLNLVGELVLSKARLHTSVTSLSALSRELDGQLRRTKHHKAPVSSGTGGFLDDLERFQRIYAELTSDLQDGAGNLDHVSGELRQQVMKLRMLPIGRVFTKYHRTVREIGHTMGKQVRLELIGTDTELDKILLEQLDDPMLHLVRNALDHGIETPEERTGKGKPPEGVLTLSAHHRGNQILIEISDDGAGIDPEKLKQKALGNGLATAEELAAMDRRQVLDLIFRPGFSTAAKVTDISGRGVGMDVVRSTIQRMSGSVEISTRPGEGTTFTLRLPLTLAIIQVLLVRLGGDDYALPLDVVVRTLSLPPDEVHRVQDRDVILLADGEQVPLIWLADALDLERPVTAEAEVHVVLVQSAGATFGLAVERLGGKREIVLKTLGDLLEQVPCAAGATLIGDRVALILDVAQVVQRGLGQRSRPPVAVAPRPTQPGGQRRGRPRVLVAEDSDVIREGIRRMLEAHGCDVVAARDGAEAIALADRDALGFDLVSTDVMMPQMDGYELTRRLRAHPRHKDVPIVMVTSRSEHIDRVRGFDAGVDEYLVKPLDSGELVRALERHLAHRPKS
jgi:two-component system chemotaxis sensor kinase CheA